MEAFEMRQVRMKLEKTGKLTTLFVVVGCGGKMRNERLGRRIMGANVYLGVQADEKHGPSASSTHLFIKTSCFTLQRRFVTRE